MNSIHGSSDFYRPRTALEAATAYLITEQGAYYTSEICFSGPNSKTAKHSVSIIRASDGVAVVSFHNLLVKNAGAYCSAAGVGSWTSYREAVEAILVYGVAGFEARA